MKSIIRRGKVESDLRFADLEVGDFFAIKEGLRGEEYPIWIKVASCGVSNAIDVVDGYGGSFDYYTEVVKLNVEIIVNS